MEDAALDVGDIAAGADDVDILECEDDPEEWRETGLGDAMPGCFFESASAKELQLSRWEVCDFGGRMKSDFGGGVIEGDGDGDGDSDGDDGGAGRFDLAGLDLGGLSRMMTLGSSR